jgi:hypothetical protein
MAAPGEFVPDVFRDASFDIDIAALEGLFGEAGLFQRQLNVHAAIYHIRHELRVCLSLVPAAHDSERDTCVTLLHESGDDGVDRALARRERVRVVAL